MRTTLFRLALLCAVGAHGQDVGTGQQPLRSLAELFLTQKPLQWVQTPTNPENPAPPTPVTGSITEVKVDVEACTLSLKDGRTFPHDGYESVQTWVFKLADLDRVRVETLEGYVDRLRAEHGQASWGAKTVPTVFALELEALPDRKFAVHRWSKNKTGEVIERDLQQPSAFVVFGEESAAREAAKALQNAKTFCASKQRR